MRARGHSLGRLANNATGGTTGKWPSAADSGSALMRFLAECFCTIPASKALLAFGAGSRKASLHETFASAVESRSHLGWLSCSRLSKALGRAYAPHHVLLFLCLHIARSCAQPAKARRAM